MNYADLGKSEKLSFQKTVSNSLNDHISDLTEQELQLPIVTDQLVVEMVDYFKEIAGFQQWAQAKLEVTFELVKEIAVKKEVSMRKKKPSEKQVNYFQSLVKEMNEHIDIPSDYLLFQYRLDKLSEKYQELGPATEKQILAVQKAWKKAFGVDLHLTENVTRGEITNYFKQVRTGQTTDERKQLATIIPFKRRG
jgi:hypothetical protein